ncbi:hypothetical protein NEIELOOT_01361 [Neisseria elongata subsp. glycolytica ATCC 29315]|uniref:Uncharacterized protein n=1 Tax=Neisseria elongata subsp. glycolytica ATCC 29315 TaxID=546263 RepID=D4DQM3_NEIEG|nr:hypothetical protein NEIELOOT_01361 [Neisseria elongata subsp. glycolytica ATCC 29315]
MVCFRWFETARVGQVLWRPSESGAVFQTAFCLRGSGVFDMIIICRLSA